MATLTIADLDNGKRDLQTVDGVANSRAASVATRYGQQTTTLYEAIRRIGERGDAILRNLGFMVPVPYAEGLTVTETNFTVIGPDGNIYAAQAGQVPFTTTAWDASQWYPIQNDLNDKKLLVFDSWAEAQAAAAVLPDGQKVDAPDSEGYPSRFSVEAGYLVFEDYASGTVEVPSYAALRGYRGRASSVFVANGAASGVFTRQTTPDFEDDGGTRILGEDGTRWVRSFGGPVVSSWFELPTFSEGDATGAARNFLKACRVYGSGVVVPGRYRITAGLIQPSGTHIVGLGSLSAWILGSPFYPMEMGVTFVYEGAIPKDYTLDNVSSIKQAGFSRANPARYYNNPYDASFDLTDFTNQDASGTQRATLRPFSAAWSMGTDGDSNKSILENIRLVPSCYATGSDDPLSGYGEATNVLPFSEVDVGLYTQCAWHCEIRDCQIVGYWNLRGVLQTSIRFGNTSSGGRGEHVHYKGCRVQSGFCVRNGDIWPVLAKTADTVTVAWTASHRFPTSGTLMLDTGNVTYTGLAFASGQLTFTGCSSTSSVIVSGVDRSFVMTTNNNGTTQTRFMDGEILDFSHASGLERPAPVFGAQSGPYRPAVELAGHPVRGVRFTNNNVYSQEPVCIHIGAAENTEVFAQTTEAKAHRNSVGGTSISPSGLFIIGPSTAYMDITPRGKRGDVTLYGFTAAGHVNRVPMRPTSSGRRFSSMTDVCNPSFYNEDAVGTDITIRYNAALPRNLAISGGAVSPTDEYFRIDTEGASSIDDLTDIVTPPWLNYVRFGTTNSSRDVVIKHNSGKISLKGAADVTLFGPNTQIAFTRYNGVWYET